MRANDNELLRRYLSHRSEAAFAELVERYLGLVYSAALRQVGGDAPAAEDLTQAVFIDLARKDASLLRHPTLAGWLYTSTRYLAANARRAALRRRALEQSAQVMNELLRPDGPEQDWTALRPVLDDAMHDLNPAERDAVLWRYFERDAFADIGARLGLNENAARMRVERALDKLRAALAKCGVTSSAAALAGLVTNQAIGSVPVGLAGRVCRTSMAAAGTGGVTALIAVWLTSSKAKVALGLLTLAAVLGLILVNWPTGVKSGSRKPFRAMDQSSNPADSPARTPQHDDVSTRAGSSEAPAPFTAQAKLRLRLVAADSDEPVTGADVRYWWEIGSESSFAHLLSDSRGKIEVAIPNGVTRIEFLSRFEGFADTMLVWRPDRGEVIPSEYVLRLARAVPLGGWVVDANGAPIAGATVEGSHPTDSLWDVQRETHIAEFKTSTDATGHWQTRRVAPELIRPLQLHASHPAHGPSPSVNVSSDAEIERQLRDGAYTLRLAAAAVVRGFVVDPESNRVAGATVLLGQLYTSGSKRTTAAADGDFEFAGVPAGKQLLTGNAEGFATTTVQIDVRPDSAPLQLVLSRGRPLSVRVLDLSGQPVAQAGVWVNASRPSTQAENQLVSELRLDAITDAEGRVLFAHVPEVDIEVGVSAKGYMELCGYQTRPGASELVLSLGPELVVTGTVRDGSTGELIPRFKVVTGRPEPQGPYWSTIGRFQMSFEGGSFRHAYNEAVVCECTNSGYLLKFEAEGYAPFTSRFIAPDERLVQLEVTLQPASTRELLVLNPNGTPAAWADVA